MHAIKFTSNSLSCETDYKWPGSGILTWTKLLSLGAVWTPTIQYTRALWAWTLTAVFQKHSTDFRRQIPSSFVLFSQRNIATEHTTAGMYGWGLVLQISPNLWSMNIFLWDAFRSFGYKCSFSLTAEIELPDNSWQIRFFLIKSNN